VTGFVNDGRRAYRKQIDDYFRKELEKLRASIRNAQTATEREGTQNELKELKRRWKEKLQDIDRSLF
jgi:hypothetical protein